MNKPTFPNVPRCPSPIIFCDCREPCSQYPDLPNRERVVTHARMTRANQTAIIVLALIIAMAVGFMMFQQSQDANAIARGDYDACWSDHCKSEITSRIVG
jgi:hypothetical protein